MLPFTYAVRNLSRDRSRLVQSILGSALVVLLVMGAHAMNAGMTRSLQSTASPRNVLLLGAGSEESMQRSEVSEQAAGIAETSLAGVESVLGQRAVSPEIVHMATLLTGEGQELRGLVRGVTSKAMLVHPEMVIQEGHFPGPGELLVGRLAWRRLDVSPETLAVGEVLTFDGVDLRVSGVLAAPGTVMESEIWMPLQDLRTFAQRDTVSSVAIRLREDAEVADVQLFTRQRLDLELSAVSETEYYAKLARFYAPIRTMTWTTAILIAAAAVFGGLNTLYAAFASRVRETATLQAIGFSRFVILISLLQESLLISMAGTLLGAVIARLLLANRVLPFGAGAIELDLEPSTLVVGLIAGMLLGFIGTLPPAFRCLYPPLPQTLRD
ncbi:ABC transporter permease [Kiritimatiellota bacterium B12222]|nr:ABC transporter permease [Kiritimatiellota bacterium B12222]